MRVETFAERERGAPRVVAGWVRWLFRLPMKYPVIWALAWTVLLLVLSLAPKRFVPSEKPVPVKGFVIYIHFDLAAHFMLYIGFAWSWIRATHSRQRWVVVAAAGLFLAIGN